jgi:adenine phosphoribosyltransferase
MAVPATKGSDVDGIAAAELVASHVLDVPDFPQPGIVFKDLSPLFADGPAFRQTVDAIAAAAPAFDLVAGIEARGFLLAAGVAYATGLGIIPVRKAGKLPRAIHAESYDLEYGTATLEIHTDAAQAGQRVLVLDDVLATGGTAQAAMALIGRTGATVVGLTVLLELAFLNGRARLPGCPVSALLTV